MRHPGNVTFAGLEAWKRGPLKRPAGSADDEGVERSASLDPRQAFARLSAEAVLCVGFASLLLMLTPYVAGARGDAVLVWLLAIVLHARVTLRFIEGCVDFLNLDCPTCSYSFHGYPDQLPHPTRTRCAHCGSELA